MTKKPKIVTFRKTDRQKKTALAKLDKPPTFQAKPLTLRRFIAAVNAKSSKPSELDVLSKSGLPDDLEPPLTASLSGHRQDKGL
jgi:hypothetical protein